jgi:hypothetical protein
MAAKVSKEKNQVAKEFQEDMEDLTVGNYDVSELDKLGFGEVDPLKGLDAVYNAGQEGFEKGVTKLGQYVGDKLCVSTKEKKPNWKAHPTLQGKVTRLLHNFIVARPNGELLEKSYGIWAAGTLTAMLKRVKRGQIIAITYDGVSDESFKPNQAPPHMFTIRGKDLVLTMDKLDIIEEGVPAGLLPTAAVQESQVRTA